MTDEQREKDDKVFREELGKLNEQEAEKRFLKDKSIGGENALRPSDEFIDANLGKERNRQELAQEAGARADKRLAQEREKDAQREKWTKYLQDQHEKKVKERGQEKGKNNELE